MSHLQIAIDGPVGSGKSHIAAQLAKRLGITYLYTGAMYRALALLCKRNSLDCKDVQHILPLLEHNTIDLQPPTPESTRFFRVYIGNEEVTDLLFNPTIDQGASDVGTIPAVREFMVKRQQQMAEGKSIVMEGRDIGLRVLPQASLKIFLTASVEERARRRFEEFDKKGLNKSYREVLEDVKVRDIQDTSRVADPLVKLPDAWELNTTGMTEEQVIESILEELNKRKLIT